MTLDYIVQPLTDPGTIAGKGRRSDFTASWTDTLAVLERELKHLQARDVVLELDVIAGQLTKDGRLRARSKAASRAVRISFETPEGPMHVDTAEFVKGYGASMTEDWQHNVRAIALGLEALRKVDRYGIGRGQQYAGYKALGTGSGAVAMGGMTRLEAQVVLHEVSGLNPGEPGSDDERRAYRRAQAEAHPDRHGGDRTTWDQVEEAAKVLGVLR